ncbi:MAG: tetratricopeptide repeat protein [Thaumarchaeota archaeon]|nr:tetratricopeptide repeat protein [Nitrososphaerota archaeon]
MPEAEHRLAAIMFTEMVGYQDALKQDESLAKRLLDKQRSIIWQALSPHGGKDSGGNLSAGAETGLKSWIRGPGGKTQTKLQSQESLVLFGSALDAIRCAIEIQRMLREYNREAPSNQDIYVRIGIHVGDVTERGGEVSGEAVAVASRVAPLAEPEGICVTQQVHDQIRGTVEVQLVRIGRHQVKDIRSTLELYKVVLPTQRLSLPENQSLDERRLAILPFVNMSADPDDKYFTDGMTEELISTVSKIRELSVISRTSVMRYRESSTPLGQIGQELNVGTVLEGSIRKSGNRVRITAQLINVESDRHLWSQNYDRNLDDIFAIQSEIAQQVAEALKVELLSSEKQRLQSVPTTNTEAYTLCLKGRHFVNERATLQSPKEAFYKAIGYFEEAAKRDPSYAAAYAGLADCYQLLGNWGFLQPQVAVQKGIEYAMKALELDETLAEAHTSMAVALSNQKWDWKGAEREYRRSLALNPSYSTAHHWYAIHLLVPLRRWNEAIKEMREAEKLDPFSSIIAANVGNTLFYAGQHQEGINQLRHVLEMDPNSAYAHVNLGTFLVSLSSIEEGTAEIQRALQIRPEEIFFKPPIAYAYVAAGRKSEAEGVLKELREASNGQYVPATLFAEVYAVLGLENLAFEWLDKAADERTSTLISSISDPMFDRLRADPRFHSLLQKIGLE